MQLRLAALTLDIARWDESVEMDPTYKMQTDQITIIIKGDKEKVRMVLEYLDKEHKVIKGFQLYERKKTMELISTLILFVFFLAVVFIIKLVAFLFRMQFPPIPAIKEWENLLFWNDSSLLDWNEPPQQL